jgi:hypothetical protein
MSSKAAAASPFDRFLKSLGDLGDQNVYGPFSALMRATSSGFLTELYVAQPAAFEAINAKFLLALAEVVPADEAPAEESSTDDPSAEKQTSGERFEALMFALPLLQVSQPNGSVTIQTIFEALSLPLREESFQKIFETWTKAWPASSLALPRGLVAWASGNLIGATTSEDDLRQLRLNALKAVYTEAEKPEFIAQRMLKSFHDFVDLLQLVPAEFWQWSEQLGPGRAAARSDFRRRRENLWRLLYRGWTGVRPHHTGLVNLMFTSAWSIANASLLPEPKKTEELDPAAAATWEAFRLSRRGRIFA